MAIFDNLDYGKKSILLDSIPCGNGLKIQVRLQKSYFTKEKIDQFHISLFLAGPSICSNMGYIYFYLDPETKTSSYIGSYVKDEYRSMGLGSLLLSYWIKLTLDNGYEALKTIQRQRKPFPLYLLKRYSFDIQNPNEYLTSPNKIYICSKDNDSTKYLIFQNAKQRATFTNGSIHKRDNYHIIPSSIDDKPDDVKVLDKIILSKIHTATNPNEGYNMAEKKLIRTKETGIILL